jgi:hypothetical protein
MSKGIDEAIRQFDIDQSHSKIYDDPNDLIEMGFPASFLLPLIKVYQSSDDYKYFCRGEIVNELIGISHFAIVAAIANHLGIPPDIGSQFTGRGFAMHAIIDAIRLALKDKDG